MIKIFSIVNTYVLELCTNIMKKYYYKTCSFIIANVILEKIARVMFLLCMITLKCRFFSAYVMFITRFSSIYLSYILQFDTPDNLRHSIENINNNKKIKKEFIFVLIRKTINYLFKFHKLHILQR